MSQPETSCYTDHAQLVLWGQYAQALGLIEALEGLSLSQKTVIHSPQSKVLQFLVGVLGGLEYLKDFSRSAHPLDKDPAVARAWGQPSWADYSGVSRTLTQLSDTDVSQINQVLEQVTQPFIDREADLAIGGGPLILDGDLSPRPVANTSRTYPGAEYGHMNDHIQLGYQAAIVSLRSRTYGRLGLSAAQHGGKTVSVTQAEALALAAEQRLGRRPRRRTELLAQRVERWKQTGQVQAERLQAAQTAWVAVQARQAAVITQKEQAEQQLTQLQAEYAQQECPERPYSALAKARAQVAVYQRRLERRQREVDQAGKSVTRQAGQYAAWQAHLQALETRLARFEADNAANPTPLQAIFRFDAGFGSADNLALLIEMGYDVYAKPYGTWLSGLLAAKSTADPADWQTVGANAQMQAWPAVVVDDFPYPVDLGYERFWTGQAYRHSGLIHFGRQAVCTDLPGWFQDYNARQTIEAGNKESKQVFEVRHLKVRSRPALRLQEYLALFSANFVRLASVWLAEQCPQAPKGWKEGTHPQVKEQVKVAAHSPARVEWFGSDILLRFEDRSVYAGRSFKVGRQIAIQLALPWKIEDFSPI
jgi:hypothetical protein